MTGLFVYGTLRRGESNHHHVASLVDQVLPDCYVFGELYDLGPYTALLTPGTQRIRGELLVSNSLDELLRITDQIEGDEYERVSVDVHQDAVPAQLAWVYRYAKDASQLNRIAAG
jgi:gamma-glutamylcyclotransferase (GGCT)/AIG2-like uncharacterized protein YtfP